MPIDFNFTSDSLVIDLPCEAREKEDVDRYLACVDSLHKLGSPYILRPHSVVKSDLQITLHYYRPRGSIFLQELLASSEKSLIAISDSTTWRVFYSLVNAVLYLDTLGISTIKLITSDSVLLCEDGRVMVSVPHSLQIAAGLPCDKLTQAQQLMDVCTCVDAILCHNVNVTAPFRLNCSEDTVVADKILESSENLLFSSTFGRAGSRKRYSSVRANVPVQLIHLSERLDIPARRSSSRPSRQIVKGFKPLTPEEAIPSIQVLRYILTLIASSSFTAIMTAKTLLSVSAVSATFDPIRDLYSQTLDLSACFLSPLIECLYAHDRVFNDQLPYLLHFVGRTDGMGRTALMHVASQPVGLLMPTSRELSTFPTLGTSRQDVNTQASDTLLQRDQDVFLFLVEQENSYVDNSGACASCYALGSGNLGVFAALKEREKHMYRRVCINPLVLSISHAPDAAPNLALLSYSDERLATGHTSLMIAAIYNAAEWVPHLIGKVNVRLPNGLTALMLAAERGHSVIVEHLVLHEATYKDQDGNTALLRVLIRVVNICKSDSKASTSGVTDSERKLLLRVVEILAKLESNIPDSQRKYPIDYAIEANDNELVQLLSNFSYPKQTGRKITRLMLACMESNYPLVCALYRAEAGLTDNSGCTALIHIAKSQATQEMLRCIQLLVRIEVGLQDKEGKTALMYACALGHLDQIKILYRYESGVLYFDKQTQQEYTELQLAEVSNAPEPVQKYLRENSPVPRDKVDRTPLMQYAVYTSRKIRTHNISLSSDSPGTGTGAGASLNNEEKAYYGSISLSEVYRYVETQAGMRDKQGRTALIYCAQYNQVGLMKLLLTKELYLKTASGETALMHCCKEPLISQKILEYLSSESGMCDNCGKTALIHAIEQENLRVANFLVSREAGVIDKTGRCALHYSVSKRSLNSITIKLIEKEGSIKDSNNTTTFMLACQVGNDKIAELLFSLEHIGARDFCGRTALMYSCHFKMDSVIKLLKEEAGASVSAAAQRSMPGVSSHTNHHTVRPMSKDCTTALHLYICAHGHNEAIIATLYEKEAKINTASNVTPLNLALSVGNTIAAEVLSRQEIKNEAVHDDKGNTPLMTAVLAKDELKIASLARHFSGLRQKKTGKTALLLAIEQEYEEACSILNKYESRLADNQGNTPLYLAIMKKNTIIINAILSYGMGFSVAPGKYALHAAMICGMVDIVAQLLDSENMFLKSNEVTPLMTAAAAHHDITPYMEYAGQQDKDGRTALIYAIIARNSAAAYALLEREINLCDKTGQTPLLYAVMQSGMNEIIPLCSLCFQKQTRRGWTALMWAAINGNTDAINMLKDKEHGFRTVDDETALMLAAKSGKAEAVASLITVESGLYITLQKSLQRGFTALHFAAMMGHVECVKLLLEYSQEAFAETPARRSAAEWARTYSFAECAILIEAAIQKGKQTKE